MGGGVNIWAGREMVKKIFQTITRRRTNKTKKIKYKYTSLFFLVFFIYHLTPRKAIMPLKRYWG